MEVEGPAPGEELNAGAPTEPRQAASVIVLRGGGDGLEVLLLRRNPAARFMGGAWVFPGGAVDAHEGEGDRRTASPPCARSRRRPACGCPTRPRWSSSRAGSRRRRSRSASTRTSSSPPRRRARSRAPTASEMVDLGWHTPAGALAAHRRGELELVFPTIKHLEQLAGVRLGRPSCSSGRPAARSSRSSRTCRSPARPRGSCCRASRRLSLNGQSSRSSAAPTTDSASIWWCS